MSPHLDVEFAKSFPAAPSVVLMPAPKKVKLVHSTVQQNTAEHSSELRIFAVVTSALPPLHLCLCTALGPFGSQYNIESIIV